MNQNSRAPAAQVIDAVVTQHQSLSTLMSNAQQKIDIKDRAFFQELVFGVLRWYPRLTFMASHLLQKPLKKSDSDIDALILVGLYQLFFMRTAEHAALNETVAGANQLKKSWATKLINGVLRNAQRRREELLNACNNDDEACTAHPLWLLHLLQTAYPHDWQSIIDANNDYPPMTLRINKQKTSRDNYLNLLIEQSMTVHACRFAPAGITLETPCDVQLLPKFSEGFCSVQDEAAQLCVALLDLAPKQTVLDACAAPGGKTAALLEAEPSLQLTALDQSESRLTRVHETLSRLQLTANIICADAGDVTSWWDKKMFDRILLDAPCSGTGVIRRHPDIKLLRKPSDIENLAKEQLRLLSALWVCLKPDGLLLYITCSVLPQENTEVIRAFLKHEKSAHALPVHTNWGEVCEFGRQLLPSVKGHDGFYYCLLKKE